MSDEYLDCADLDAALAQQNTCCISCIDDWNQGYDTPMEIEYRGKTYHVCCWHAHADEED